MLKAFINNLSVVFPYQGLQQVVKPKVIAPFWHLVSPSSPAHVKHLYSVHTPERFRKDLDFFLRNFIPVDSKELLKVISGEKKLPKPAVFISFDDGFQEIKSVVAPILLEMGVPATFCVSPAFVGNHNMLYRCKLSLISDYILRKGFDFNPSIISLKGGKRVVNRRELIKEFFKLGINDIDDIHRIASEVGVDFSSYLDSYKPYITIEDLKYLASKGFTIGAHSLNHPLFSDISAKEQVEEVEQSLQWVVENFTNQPNIFAFPFTNYGVNQELYQYFFVENPGKCDLMLGTAGYKPTSKHWLLHRIPMEENSSSASRILKGQFFYYICKLLINKHIDNPLV